MSLLEKNRVKLEGVEFDLNPKAKEITVSIGKERAKMSFESLWNMAFMLADTPEIQDRLMPVRKTEMMEFDRVHNIVAKRDIKKGETIKAICHVHVPQTVVDALLKPELEKMMRLRKL